MAYDQSLAITPHQQRVQQGMTPFIDPYLGNIFASPGRPDFSATNWLPLQESYLTAQQPFIGAFYESMVGRGQGSTLGGPSGQMIEGGQQLFANLGARFGTDFMLPLEQQRLGHQYGLFSGVGDYGTVTYTPQDPDFWEELGGQFAGEIIGGIGEGAADFVVDWATGKLVPRGTQTQTQQPTDVGGGFGVQEALPIGRGIYEGAEYISGLGSVPTNLYNTPIDTTLYQPTLGESLSQGPTLSATEGVTPAQGPTLSADPSSTVAPTSIVSGAGPTAGGTFTAAGGEAAFTGLAPGTGTLSQAFAANPATTTLGMIGAGHTIYTAADMYFSGTEKRAPGADVLAKAGEAYLTGDTSKITMDDVGNVANFHALPEYSVEGLMAWFDATIPPQWIAQFGKEEAGRMWANIHAGYYERTREHEFALASQFPEAIV